MKKVFSARNKVTLAVCTLGMPLAAMSQTAVFTDNFANGSTFNGTSTPGGTPTASSTSYDFDSQKTGVESISSGNLNMALSSATTGGAIEAEALFTSTPVQLVTPGDYINLTYTFTDVGNILPAIDGSSSSSLYTGLYYSGGSAPIAGTANTSGNAVTLNAAGSPTGGVEGWEGYYGNITGNGGTSKIFTRPVQTGSSSGTSSAQDLVGNNAFTGAFGKTTPGIGATQIGSSTTSPGLLTTGDQYTLSYTITLASATSLTIAETLTGPSSYSFSQSVTASGATFLNTEFDGLDIGVLNNGVSANPQMDINSIAVTDEIQAVPEPSTLALGGLGSLALFLNYRRRVHS